MFLSRVRENPGSGWVCSGNRAWLKACRVGVRACIERGIGNMRESAWSSGLCELTQGAQKEGHKGASEGILRIIPGVTLSRKQNDILHFGWLPGPAGP